MPRRPPSPRFKKLVFKHDRLLTDSMRARALLWFKMEFNKNFKGKVGAAAPTGASGDGPHQPHLKRRKTSAAGFFADSDSEESAEEEGPSDELEAYLALPQIKYKTESDATEWWQTHAKQFPNVSVMARQYLGCPASSAAVERLFSQVGIAYAAKRKRAGAATLEDIMFSRCNLP